MVLFRVAPRADILVPALAARVFAWLTGARRTIQIQSCLALKARSGQLIALVASQLVAGLAFSTLKAIARGAFEADILTGAFLADHEVGVVIAVVYFDQRVDKRLDTSIQRDSELSLVLDHEEAFSLDVASERARNLALRAVFDSARRINALVQVSVEPVVLCADFADFGVRVAHVALLDLACQTRALLLPLVEVVPRPALVAVVDARDAAVFAQVQLADCVLAGACFPRERVPFNANVTAVCP